MNRRRFLSTSGKTTAGLAVGWSLWSSGHQARAQSANDKVLLALIGAGGRGSGLARNLANVENVEFKYICDPNTKRGGDLIRDLGKGKSRAPQHVTDMRRVFEDAEVHGVVVATPEHWHALASIWACQAGKDVYVEKNISLTVWEGRKMIEAARKYDRVVQAGFQNRSAPYAVSARDYLRSGKLGKVVLVKVYNLLGGGGWSPRPDGSPPEGLDWDLWLGPAPERPFNAGRFGGWGDFWDYAGGALAGDASHQLDLTRMVLGDPPHPKSTCCMGGRFGWKDQREIPDIQAITYDYGDFIMTCENGTSTPYMKKFPGEVRYGTQWPQWPMSATRVEIYGTQQLMYLGRHGCGWQVVENDGKVVAQDKGHFPDKWHQPNFVECIRTRKRPNADVEQGHYSACLVHFGNVSYRVGNQQLAFDAARERFTNHDAANRLLKPEYRKHYRIPDVV